MERLFWLVFSHFIALLVGVVLTLIFKQKAINKLKEANAAMLSRLP